MRFIAVPLDTNYFSLAAQSVKLCLLADVFVGVLNDIKIIFTQRWLRYGSEVATVPVLARLMQVSLLLQHCTVVRRWVHDHWVSEDLS